MSVPLRGDFGMSITRRMIWLGLFLSVQCPCLAAESAEGERTSTGWGIGRLNRVDTEDCELDLKVLRQVSHETRLVATQVDGDRDLMLREWLEGPTELTGPIKNSEGDSLEQESNADEPESVLPPTPSEPNDSSEPKESTEPPPVDRLESIKIPEPIGLPEPIEPDKPIGPAPVELPTPAELNPAGGMPRQVDEATDSDEEKLADALQADTRRQRLFERFAKLHSPPGAISLASPISTEETLPENQAADLLAQEPTRYIASRGLPISIAPRVHTRFCHQPLYFEELNLERCGRVDCEKHGCLQNLYSTFWFFTGTTILPYRLATEPMGCCVTSGSDCRTCQSNQCSIARLKTTENNLPMPRGLAAEAAAIAGFTFLLL